MTQPIPSRGPQISSSLHTPPSHLARQDHPSTSPRHESYGGAEGDPKSEAPQDQGSNPSAEKEHPCASPPADSGRGPTKATEIGQKAKGNASSSDNARQGRPTKSGAQPKSLNKGLPAEPSDEVKQHNEETTHRHDRAGAQAGDSQGQ